MATEAGVVNALSFDIEDWFHLVAIDAVADSERWGDLPTLVERREPLSRAARPRGLPLPTGGAPLRAAALGPHDPGAAHEHWAHRREAHGVGGLLRNLAPACRAASTRPRWAARGRSASPGCVARHLRVVLTRWLLASLPGSRLPRLGALLGPSTDPGGGGYLRLLPYWLIARSFRRFNARGMPVVTYLHPRDFAADCPRVPMPWHRRFKSTVGLRTTDRKLRRLLAEIRFGTCWEVLRAQLPPGGGG